MDVSPPDFLFIFLLLVGVALPHADVDGSCCLRLVGVAGVVLALLHAEADVDGLCWLLYL